MRRVLITGSRDWDDWATLSAALTEEWNAVEWRHGSFTQKDVVFVHGDCPTGADRMADGWCFRMDIEPERHPADWDRYGKAAGFVRNAGMVDLGADVCLAFIKNESKGATMTAELALKAGIPLKVWTA